MSKQKFAWKPTKVWNMKNRDYKYTTIWLCWYWWESDEPDTSSVFCRLSDDHSEDNRMWNRNKTRTSTNRW